MMSAVLATAVRGSAPGTATATTASLVTATTHPASEQPIVESQITTGEDVIAVQGSAGSADSKSTGSGGASGQAVAVHAKGSRVRFVVSKVSEDVGLGSGGKVQLGPPDPGIHAGMAAVEGNGVAAAKEKSLLVVENATGNKQFDATIDGGSSKEPQVSRFAHIFCRKYRWNK